VTAGTNPIPPIPAKIQHLTHQQASQFTIQ
jgi:hypothetical protein